MEIRFRAWDKLNNKMIYDVEYTYDYRCIGLGANEGYFGEVLDSDDYFVMQYIGLNDYNGKRIYEGDIVIWDKCPEYKHSYNKSIAKFEIIWQIKKCGFGMKSASKDRYRDYNMQSGRNLAVIGNIYENPELLEGVNYES